MALCRVSHVFPDAAVEPLSPPPPATRHVATRCTLPAPPLSWLHHPQPCRLAPLVLLLLQVVVLLLPVHPPRFTFLLLLLLLLRRRVPLLLLLLLLPGCTCRHPCGHHLAAPFRHHRHCHVASWRRLLVVVVVVVVVMAPRPRPRQPQRRCNRSWRTTTAGVAVRRRMRHAATSPPLPPLVWVCCRLIRPRLPLLLVLLVLVLVLLVLVLLVLVLPPVTSAQALRPPHCLRHLPVARITLRHAGLAGPCWVTCPVLRHPCHCNSHSHSHSHSHSTRSNSGNDGIGAAAGAVGAAITAAALRTPRCHSSTPPACPTTTHPLASPQAATPDPAVLRSLPRSLVVEAEVGEVEVEVAVSSVPPALRL